MSAEFLEGITGEMQIKILTPVVIQLTTDDSSIFQTLTNSVCYFLLYITSQTYIPLL